MYSDLFSFQLLNSSLYLQFQDTQIYISNYVNFKYEVICNKQWFLQYNYLIYFPSICKIIHTYHQQACNDHWYNTISVH